MFKGTRDLRGKLYKKSTFKGLQDLQDLSICRKTIDRTFPKKRLARQILETPPL